ncbi:cylicin, basic protein of sperm head cytoskeleton 2 [Yasminevirus sp. GU-2018]|uniref:Cylicin, basic protein of sperm head cytoskeleton 2 n=1 Tax=Yasminevirus sp. GU-2018 TaxID=2420051 RepID=A0A5K0UAY2_9VIRU|nr:cylicin, basic protein of sperm head cytoskeleton 2 [Yasminevirus sp. GU-2018]
MSEKNTTPPPPNELAKQKAFFKDFEPFLTQAVTGGIMAYLQTLGTPKSEQARESVTNLLGYFSKVYLNGCWHSYGKKNDKYVVDTFDKLLKHDVIRGSVCLVHWIDNLCMAVFKTPEIFQLMMTTNTVPIPSRREIISKAVNIIIQTYLSKIEGSVRCKGTCNDTYDGKDFFLFKIVN